MFQQAIKLLLIEDNPGDARLIREMLLEAQHVAFNLVIADRLSAGLNYLEQEIFDALLIDLSLPDSSGIETLVRVHSQIPGIPIVVLTGFNDEATGIRAVQEGAQDYLVKGQVDSHLLVRAVRYAIERKRIDAELEWERAKLRAILDGMGEGVIYHENFRSRYINPSLTTMTGYTVDEFDGYLDLLRSENQSPADFQRLYDQMQHSMETDGIWRGELRLRRQDGTEFDAGLTCTPITTTDGSIVGAVTLIRDISQEKALQAQKSRFVANASHELRTPLTNLKTTLYLLRRQPEELEEHVNVLEYVVDRMRGLVDDLLDMTRFERGTLPLQRQVIMLQDLVNEVVKVQSAEASKKHIELTTHLNPNPLYVHADQRRITQVITNLVINAINYTPDQGWVKVELAVEGPNQAVICVRDSGIGIPSDMLSRIFQPFVRVNEGLAKGTGLGLTITKEIVELHGGQIEVRSEFGHGSAFYVRLALVQPEYGKMRI